MIPYFRYTTFPIGPVNIQVWGLFVATGIIVAALVAAREARRARLRGDVIADIAAWAVIPALVGARIFHVIAYDLRRYAQDPLAVLRVWEGGLSSFGGFIGAAIGLWIFSEVRKGKIIGFRAYLEAVAYAFPLGYAIGRIGCFLIHDHPGTLSDALLSVKYPDGARLDHGLLLSLLSFGIFAIFMVLKGGRAIRPAHPRFLSLLMIMYGLMRFPLDFFRAWDLPLADARYLGLTPAQYGAIVLVVLGTWLRYHELKVRRVRQSS